MNAFTKTILVALLVSATSVHAKSLFGDAIDGAIGKITGNGLVKHQDMESKLIELANQANKQLPRDLNKNQRADYDIAGPGLHYTYNYIMLNYPSSQDIDNTSKAHFRQSVQSFLNTQACTSTDLELLFKNGVTVSYIYRASDGGLMAKVDFTPKDCGYAT